MKMDGFFDGFLEVHKLQDFLHTICFGFAKDFRIYWDGINKELAYWKNIEYDKKDGAEFVIALFPTGSIRVMSNDRGEIGHDPDAIYCKIRTRHAERFDVGEFTDYRVYVSRGVKEEQA